MIVMDASSNNHGRPTVMAISEYIGNLDASHIILVLS